MKKFLSAVLSITVVASLMIGCSNSSDSGKETAASSTAENSVAAVSSTEAPKDPSKVSWMTWEYTSNKDILDKLVQVSKDKFNVDLSIENFPTDQYENTVKVRFTSGELSDIIGVHSVQSGYGNTLAKQGAFMDISASPVLGEYLPVASDLSKLEGKQYYIANNGAVLGVFYNKKIFSDLNLAVPTNRAEFDAVSEKIKAANLVPIANGYKDGWTVQIIPFISIAQAFQTGDPDALIKFGNGTLKYTDPKMAEALNVIVDFGNKGYYQDKFIGQDFLTAASQIASGKAAMMVNGTWVYKNITDANPDAQIGFFALPLVNEGEKITLPGSFEGGVAINANSKVPDAAKSVWEYYYSAEVQQQLADAGSIQPTNKNVTMNLAINKEIQDAMKSAGYVTPAWHGTYQPGGLNDVMWKGLQAAMVGEGSAESVAAEMEKFNADAVAKAQK